MGHLYAALFSGGLTKVGRSKTVAGRISQHAARLSVAALEVIESHGAPCLGDIASAEQALIARCAEAATERRGNEWFVGLDFVQVRTWVDEACEEFSSELQSQSPRYVVRLDSFPIPREGAYVCRACCRHYPAINALDPFVCGSCGEFGYRYYVGRLELGAMKDTEIIDSLGGPAKLAELLGYDKDGGGVQRVHNWRTRGIPSKVKLEHPELFASQRRVRAPAATAKTRA